MISLLLEEDPGHEDLVVTRHADAGHARTSSQPEGPSVLADESAAGTVRLLVQPESARYQRLTD